MKRLLFVFLPCLFLLALTVLILRPIPAPTEENCETVEGTVQLIFEAGEKDVCFQLEETDEVFYINRGLEKGLILNDLRTQLVGRKVRIRYPRYWTPLDPKNRVRHLGELAASGQILYSEMR